MRKNRFAAPRATALLFGWATLAACSAGGDAADPACVASPVTGAPCDPAASLCHPGGSCGAHWTCEPDTHRWSEVISTCFIEPIAPFPDAGDAGSLGDD